MNLGVVISCVDAGLRVGQERCAAVHLMDRSNVDSATRPSVDTKKFLDMAAHTVAFVRRPSPSAVGPPGLEPAHFSERAIIQQRRNRSMTQACKSIAAHRPTRLISNAAARGHD